MIFLTFILYVVFFSDFLIKRNGTLLGRIIVDCIKKKGVLIESIKLRFQSVQIRIKTYASSPLYLPQRRD